MSPFWASFLEHLKHCGRNATLFIVALAGFFVLLAVGVAVFETGLYRYLLPAAPFIAIFLLVWAGVSLRRAFVARRHRLRHPPLSDDELRKARTRLRR